MQKPFLTLACAVCLICGNVARAQEKPIDFTTQIQPIFAQNCAVIGCHAGSFPAEGMSLEAGKAYDNIVDVKSQEASSAMRIKPGDAENSYLYRKLEGEQRELGGSGSRMPQGRNPLSTAQIETIKNWITQGALNN